MKTTILTTMCVLSSVFCAYASDIHGNHVQEPLAVQRPHHKLEGHTYTMNDVGLACFWGNLERLKSLIANGGSFEECMEDDIYMYDAMYAAVYGGQKHVVDYLIEKGLNVNRFYTEDGETPLFMACMRNRIDIAEALLRAGADANGVGEMGGDYILYPLIEAVYNRNLALAKLLVENGADVNVINKQGESPLDYAIRSEDAEMIALLKQSMESAPESVKKEGCCGAAICPRCLPDKI